MRLKKILFIGLLVGLYLSGFLCPIFNAHAQYVLDGKCPVDRGPNNDRIWQGHPVQKDNRHIASWYTTDPPSQIVTAFSPNCGTRWVAIHKCSAVFPTGNNCEASEEKKKCDGWQKIFCLNVDRLPWTPGRVVAWIYIYDIANDELRQVGLDKDKNIISDRTIKPAPGFREDIPTTINPPQPGATYPHKNEIDRQIDKLRDEKRLPDEMIRTTWTLSGDYPTSLGETICLEFDLPIDTVTVSWHCDLGGEALFSFPDYCDACDLGFPSPDSVVRGNVLSNLEGDWLQYFTSYYSGFKQQEQQQCTSFEWQLDDKIPTLTEWGLIIFGLLLIGFITWVFLRRRKAVAVSVVES